MKKIIFLSVFALSFLISNAYSQTSIKFVNNTNLLVSAAYAIYTDNGNGWESHGWFNVNAGQTLVVSIGDYNYTNLYVYGFNKTTDFGSGQYQFCVDTKKAFTMANADVNCNLVKKTFSEFAISPGEENTWTFGEAGSEVVKKQNNSKTQSKDDGKTQTGKLTSAQANEFVMQHNYWRDEVNSPNIVWSQELADFAYDWAKHLADNDLFEHRQNNNYGENIFMCYSCTDKTYTPAKVVDNWADEKALYHGETISNTNYMNFGHYTQIIWCTTTKVGCGMAQTKNGNMVVVCNYSPAGNYIGKNPVCK
jgi:uncharacterized protein YkwD